MGGMYNAHTMLLPVKPQRRDLSQPGANGVPGEIARWGRKPQVRTPIKQRAEGPTYNPQHEYDVAYVQYEVLSFFLGDSSDDRTCAVERAGIGASQPRGRFSQERANQKAVRI